MPEEKPEQKAAKERREKVGKELGEQVKAAKEREKAEKEWLESPEGKLWSELRGWEWSITRQDQPYAARGAQLGLTAREFRALNKDITQRFAAGEQLSPAEAYIGGYSDISPQGFPALSQNWRPTTDILRRGAGYVEPGLEGEEGRETAYGSYGQPAYGKHAMPEASTTTLTRQYMPKGLSPAQQEYFKSASGDIYQDYLAELRKQGETRLQQSIRTTSPFSPDEPDFEKFIKRYPWLEKYKSMTPRQKGEYQPRFAPRAKWLGY